MYLIKMHIIIPFFLVDALGQIFEFIGIIKLKFNPKR